MINHLYLHVPFCKTICSYCDFCHTVYNSEIINKWLTRIEDDLNQINGNDIQTIYIGGGTPSSLSVDELKRLLTLLNKFSKNVIEYTIEVNPETINEEKVELIKSFGINRVSIGLQSSEEHLLKLMNRHHTFTDVKNCIELFRKYGIDNISVDIMYSLPGQTLNDLKKTLELTIDLDVKHISLYSLTIEKGTIFDSLNYKPLDSDTEADMYEYIEDFLINNGYVHYEIANFAKCGYESKHNLGYWNYDDYYGIGAGATGKYNHKRYTYTKNINDYISKNDHVFIEDITNEDEAFENIMMSLRTKYGLDINTFNEKYHLDFINDYKDALKMNNNNLLIKDNRCICSRLEILNTILLDFMK